MVVCRHLHAGFLDFSAHVLWIFYVFFYLVFAMPLCVSAYMCLVVTLTADPERGQRVQTPLENHKLYGFL